MYLHQIFVENVGPTKRFAFELAFSASGAPIPFVLVGGNGSGKTNLLSLVADALFEIAAMHFEDVTPSVGMSRPWFRIVGGITTHFGAQGGIALLEFREENHPIVYQAKSGKISPDAIEHLVPEALKGHLKAPEGNIKKVTATKKQALAIFRGGAYVYFPSSRAEFPGWLNKDSVAQQDFDLDPRFDSDLKKPIFVERGLHELKQWLLAVLIDVRADYREVVTTDGNKIFVAAAEESNKQRPLWHSINSILSVILEEPSARLVWTGRHSADRISILSNGRVIPLDALSAGQSTLLTIFGTLLRYGDVSRAAVRTQELQGICIVDEIDAHMHVELQARVLPELIGMFPKVQFLLSSHSPLFALGMEALFEGAGVSIVEMPDGIKIGAEAYGEFLRAIDRYRNTQSFQKAVAASAGNDGKVLVFLEGETDPFYFRAAAAVLDREDILDKFEFEWIGSKDPSSGQGYFTGKDALNSALTFFRANPSLVARKVILLYDNDAKKRDEQYVKVFVRSVPCNAENSLIKSGIENLLPQNAISADAYDTKESKKANGTQTVTRTVNKMRLCKAVCAKPDAEYFSRFGDVLDILEAVLDN